MLKSARLLWTGSIVLLALTRLAHAQSNPILDLDTGGQTAVIKDIAFTSDGRFILSAGDDKVVRIWDVEQRRTVRTLRGEIGDSHHGKIFALAISPDDRFVAVGGWMAPADAERLCCGDIRVFDFTTGRLVKRLQGHEGPIYDLAFSPDGSRLASAAGDARAFIWTMPDGAIGHCLEGHDGSVSRIAFADNGRTVTGGADGTLRLWSAPDGKTVATIGDKASRAILDVSAPVGRLPQAWLCASCSCREGGRGGVSRAGAPPGFDDRQELMRTIASGNPQLHPIRLLIAAPGRPILALRTPGRDAAPGLSHGFPVYMKNEPPHEDAG